MKLSIRKGFSFGLTSGIITTLGLIVGLNYSTHSKLVVIGGILVIAISDAMSDALGIHVSEESENKNTHKEVWESTISTFLSKFIFALTFILPVILFELPVAISICIGWGIALLILFNYYISKIHNMNPARVIFEHVILAIIVIIITYYVGNWVSTLG